MEKELKYLIDDEETQNRLWNEDVFRKYGDVDSRGTKEMKAVYYDTEDGLLRNVDAAFRIRKENDRTFATLKWGGFSQDALHEREELNLCLCANDQEACGATLSIFSESEKGKELIELVGDKKLIPTVETRYTRRIMRIDIDEAICEAVLDTGEIIAFGKSTGIRELEIELYSGSQEAMEAVGADLAERFSLRPGTKSKYGRGLELGGKL